MNTCEHFFSCFGSVHVRVRRFCHVVMLHFRQGGIEKASLIKHVLKNDSAYRVKVFFRRNAMTLLVSVLQ
jgi:hypothetical protein